MNPLEIIFDHYRPGSRLADILIRHSEQVRDKALEVAAQVPHLKPDTEFIAEAAMLHDIGIYQTASAQLGCIGNRPYVCHGLMGRKILDQYGLTAHALVCERHVGVGITMADIQEQHLPLPLRDMAPVTMEEIIICYADKFFSKTNGGQEHTLETVATQVARFGRDKTQRFMQWHHQFYPSGL